MFVHTGAPVTLPELSSETLPSGIRHYVTPDGERYPSVTTVLGRKEKPWLENWRKMLGDKKADKEQKRCADRGTAVHGLVERYLNNEDEFTRGYKPEYVRGFNQLKIHLNRINNIRTQEAALFSDTLKIAGRVDCIAEYNGTPSIVDFKTSNNNKDRDMVFDYFLQCTAYAIMWHEMTGEPIDNIVVLMNVERGLVPLVFEDKIDKYVSPLLKRVNEYHKEQTNAT